MKKIVVAATTSLLLYLPSVHAADGDRSWSNTLSAGYTWSTPIIVDNQILVQDQEGGMEAFSASDGQQLWHKDYDDNYPTNSPVYANGSVFLISGEFLHRIDPATGNLIDSFTADASISSQSPAIYDDLVLFGTSNRTYAVDYNTMTERWSAESESNPINIIIDDDVAYVTADKLYAYNVINGNLLWSETSTTANGFYIGAVRGDYLVAFDTNGSGAKLSAYQLNANRALNPSYLWSSSAFGNNSADNSTPVIHNDKVYATGREGVLRALSLADGSESWNVSVRNSGAAPALPIAVGENVYVQIEDDTLGTQLASINSTTGAINWRTSEDNMSVAWGAPVISNGQIILATDGNGTILAFSEDDTEAHWPMIKHNPQLTGSTIAGVRSEVDTTSFVVSLPQVYLEGSGVFDVVMQPEDLDNLIFTVDLTQVQSTAVPISDLAIYNGATGQLDIPKLQFGDQVLNVSLSLINTIENTLYFQVTSVQ